MPAPHHRSSPSFYFSWVQSVARVFVSMATLQSDATKTQPVCPLGFLAQYQHSERYSSIGWHPDWLMCPATVPSKPTLNTTPNSFHNHLLRGYAVLCHTMYYSWCSCRNVSDSSYSKACVRQASECLLLWMFAAGWGTTMLWEKTSPHKCRQIQRESEENICCILFFNICFKFSAVGKCFN